MKRLLILLVLPCVMGAGYAFGPAPPMAVFHVIVDGEICPELVNVSRIVRGSKALGGTKLALDHGDVIYICESTVDIPDIISGRLRVSYGERAYSTPPKHGGSHDPSRDGTRGH